MSKPVTESIQLQDNQFLHPWEDIKKIGQNKRTVIANADGIYIEDSDGNKLLDGPAGMWCVNIGHRRPPGPKPAPCHAKHAPPAPEKPR